MLYNKYKKRENYLRKRDIRIIILNKPNDTYFYSSIYSI